MRGLDAFKAFVTAVREQSDLVRIVSRDVELRRAGNTLKGLSPFHQEKHASFVIWPATQTWHDFSGGGGLGGDVFSYVQEREKIGFKEAVLLLAEQAGLKPPNQDEESWKRSLAIANERREVERLLTLAAGYYHRALPPEIRAHYQRHYGFTDETIDELQLGWADGKLLRHLTETTGLGRGQLLATGLFHPLNDGRIVDYFRRRLVFPYWSRGRVVYFTARALDPIGKLPKYLKLRVHGPEQPYISPTIRNDHLFNEDAARGAEELVVTEGTPDCISARQAGVACVSPGTTSIRQQDLPRLFELSRSAKRIVICNDTEANGAGDKSAQQLAAAFWAQGRDVAIASIPLPAGAAKIDLNELVVAHGAEGLRAVLGQALPYPEFLLARLPQDAPKLELDALLEPVLAAALRCPPIRADTIVEAIVAKFGLRRTAVRATLKGLEQKLEPGPTRKSAKPAGGGRAAPSSPPSGGGGHEGSPSMSTARAEISVTGRHLIDLVRDAGGLLVRANEQRCQHAAKARVDDDQAPLVVRGNVLCRLTYPHDAPAALVVVTEPAMYGFMMREINWVKETENGPVPATPPDKVAKDLIVFPPPAIPRVNKVITTPMFNRDGDLVIEPGLHARDQLWHDQDPSLQIGEIPGHPTAEDIAAARSLFLNEMLVDFKFESQSDRAHALAALLLPFMQRMIDGCTPLHLMEAPGAGAGKGLLCNMVSILVTGEECAAQQLPLAHDEARKTLTAELLAARPLILLDNAKDTKVVDSPALAAVLTARTWTDRFLGLSEMVTVANNSMWMMTGNNPKLARDIARRSVRIRIDPKVDEAWRRKGFKHDPLEQWAKDHRSELIRAALVLIQSWIAAGRPLSRARLGSFQQWAHFMGGVLELIGVPGFLGNLDQLYAHADDEGTAWREFTKAWWDAHGSSPVQVSVLLALCEQQQLLAEVLGDGSSRAQQTRLGRALQRARDRMFGDLRVVVGEADRKARTMYSLQRMCDEEALTEPGYVSPADGARSVGQQSTWFPHEDDDDDDES